MQDKQLRLIEFFAGYGSQHKAFDYLDLKVESWKICEWAVKSIQAYKDLHFKDDNNDYSKDLTKEDLVKFLTDKGISANYNEPMSEEQIKRLTEDKLRTIYNNIKATHNLVNIQQVKGSDLEIVDTDKYDYMLTYSFPCGLAGTKIITKNGYKNIEDITTDDLVLTHSNRFCKVNKTMTRISDHYYKLKGLGVPELYLTEEHPLYVFRDNKFQWVKVKDLKLTDMFSFNINQNENDIDLSKEYLWLLGRYVADGHVNKHTNNSVNFSISFDKEQQFLENIPKDFIPRFKKFKKQVWDYRIADKQLKDICLEFKTGAVNKEIPQWVIDLPKEKLQAFFDGYISGDGHIRHRGNETQIMFSTVSESLFLGMQQIVTKLYRCLITCSIRHDNRKASFNDTYNCQFNLTPHHRDQFVYKDKICTKIKHIEKFDEDVPVYNFEVESDNSYTCQNVIVHNCQDLSNAGLGKGMGRDSGTRSGMLWEVERILKELKDSNSPLPKYLLMENVTQVHGENSIKDFTDWCNFLKSIGYTNSWADMNSKNFGIPQNRDRTFMVSILDNDGVFFQFPQQIRLDIRLKDLLEDKVDEKYYLSDAIVSKLAIRSPLPEDTTGIDLNDTDSVTRDVASTIKARYDCGYEHFTPGPTGVIEPKLKPIAKTTDGNNFNSVYSDEGISPTLLARDYKDPVRVATSDEEIIQVAQMYPNSGNPQAGRVYESDGLSPCLDTCQGGNREVKIVEETCSELQKEVCNRAVNYMQEGDVIDYTYSNSRLEEMNNGFIKTKNSEDNTIMNTLTTNSEAFGVCVKEPRICASRGRNPNDPTSRKSGEHLEQMIELGPKGLSNTLTTIQKDNYLLESNSAQAIKEPTGEDNLKRQLCNKLIEENMVSEGDVIRHSYTNSRFDSFHIENKDNPDCCSTITTRADCIGVVENKPCPTLDTRCDCLGVVVNETEKSMYTEQEKKLFTEDGNIKRYLHSDIVDKFEEGQMATTSFPNGYGHGSRTHDESIALTTVERPSVKHNLRIRKLTPKECWRLMGIKDEDFEKVAENQSNASLYHLAGDSIVTTCLMAIFGKLLNVDYREKIRNLLKDLSPNFDFESIEPEVICERHNLLDDLLGDWGE